MGASGRERRRHPRARADWPVHLMLPGGTLEARLRDVSPAGLCFFLEQPIPEMTVLALAFALPGDARPVQCRGAVVRCERISPALEHYEVALFLHEIADADRARIEAFVVRAGGS